MQNTGLPILPITYNISLGKNAYFEKKLVFFYNVSNRYISI